MKFIKKSPVTLELEKIEKEEKRLEQRALSRTVVRNVCFDSPLIFN